MRPINDASAASYASNGDSPTTSVAAKTRAGPVTSIRPVLDICLSSSGLTPAEVEALAGGLQTLHIVGHGDEVSRSRGDRDR